MKEYDKDAVVDEICHIQKTMEYAENERTWLERVCELNVTF